MHKHKLVLAEATSESFNLQPQTLTSPKHMNQPHNTSRPHPQNYKSEKYYH